MKVNRKCFIKGHGKSNSSFSLHDLRCGNILNYDTAEGEILPTVIDWQDLKWLTEDPKGFNLVHSPIPLTAEYLKKFGFSDGDYKDRYKSDEIFIKIEYVHELQNLYFDLTGEWLSLKSQPIRVRYWKDIHDDTTVQYGSVIGQTELYYIVIPDYDIILTVKWLKDKCDVLC
jgi:hypothetical protein